MKKIAVLIFAVMVIVLFAFCYMDADPVSVTITWTAPFDPKPDGSGSQCAEYDLRQSGDSTSLMYDWNACARIDILPPLDSGMAEVVIVHNLLEETHYYFAIKSKDSAGNWSEISNIAHTYVDDATRPVAVIDLREQQTD